MEAVFSFSSPDCSFAGVVGGVVVAAVVMLEWLEGTEEEMWITELDSPTFEAEAAGAEADPPVDEDPFADADAEEAASPTWQIATNKNPTNIMQRSFCTFPTCMFCMYVCFSVEPSM